MSSVRVICENCEWSSTRDSAIYSQVGYKVESHGLRYTVLARNNDGGVVREGYREGGKFLSKSDFPPCPGCKQLGTIHLEVYCKPCKKWTQHPQIFISSNKPTVEHSFACGDCERRI